ncbi:MAG TPA: GatB/YqeY domain-containing protein [Candidatus Paceibacterota bacterium]
MHENIKNQIKDAMRAKDTIRLEVLRGLQALFSNELIAKGIADPLLKDTDVLTIIKRSVKQRKDSIEQFEKGGRNDLAKKEKAELKILEEFLPETMNKKDIEKIVKEKIKKAGKIDKAKIGQFIGMIMKELKDKADGNDVKQVVDELVKG